MSENQTGIRKPAVAGLFYPSDPSTLVKDIAQMYATVEKIPVEYDPVALIAPHAGYPYSGKTAARAYKLLEGRQYDTVVIISPSHTVFFKGSSVFDGFGYETPLGVVEINAELSEKISSISPTVYFSNIGHATGSNRGEHALEVQLPFLQVMLGKFKLVAIVMGDQEEDSINGLAEVLASTLRGTNTLLVASTDLSHFHPQKQANRLDSHIEKAIKAFDPEMLIDYLERGKGEACGGGIVAAVMKAAKRLGGSRVEFLEYTTSGETTGDFDEVVGYLSAAIIGGDKVKKTKNELLGIPEARPKKEEFILTESVKKELLNIAHTAIKAKLEGVEYSAPELYDVKRGLFVTIELDGHLRGCIGQIRSSELLSKAVADMAVAAAFDDPRFPQLTEKEFEKLDIEISILSPLKLVSNINDIKVGRDGLLIKMDMHSGLLLPQVATDYRWDRITFLEQTCLKAGLPKNSYMDKYAEIFRFEAEVF